MYINIRRLLSGGMDRMVWLWDIATGLRVRISSALENNVCPYVCIYTCIHACTYCKYFGFIKVRGFSGHEDSVFCLGELPDGRT